MMNLDLEAAARTEQPMDRDHHAEHVVQVLEDVIHHDDLEMTRRERSVALRIREVEVDVSACRSIHVYVQESFERKLAAAQVQFRRERCWKRKRHDGRVERIHLRVEAKLGVFESTR